MRNVVHVHVSLLEAGHTRTSASHFALLFEFYANVLQVSAVAPPSHSSSESLLAPEPKLAPHYLHSISESCRRRREHLTIS